jgi:hypothetical protein
LSTSGHHPYDGHDREGTLLIRHVNRDSHRLRLCGHFHHNVCLTFGQGFRVALWGLDYLDCGTLRGGHDRAEGDSAREGGHGRTLPQCESGPFAGGKVGVESTATAEGS